MLCLHRRPRVLPPWRQYHPKMLTIYLPPHRRQQMAASTLRMTPLIQALCLPMLNHPQWECHRHHQTLFLSQRHHLPSPRLPIRHRGLHLRQYHQGSRLAPCHSLPASILRLLILRLTSHRHQCHHHPMSSLDILQRRRPHRQYPPGPRRILHPTTQLQSHPSSKRSRVSVQAGQSSAPASKLSHHPQPAFVQPQPPRHQKRRQNRGNQPPQQRAQLTEYYNRFTERLAKQEREGTEAAAGTAADNQE